MGEQGHFHLIQQGLDLLVKENLVFVVRACWRTTICVNEYLIFNQEHMV